MRLLDRYLLRELLIPFGYCLSGFLLFIISFDLINELDDFQKLKLRWTDIAEYYVIRAPELLVMVLPIALLLALLYCLTNHARHHELTAMRAAGISLGRLAAPYLAVGFVLSLALFAMNELWVPQGAAAAERVLSRRVGHTGHMSASWEAKLGFTSAHGNRMWFIAAYNTKTYDMTHPHVEWIRPDGAREVVIAEAGAWRENAWMFTNVQRWLYPAGRGALPEAPLETNLMAMPELTETPEEIKSEIKVSRINSFKEAKKAQLSIREILDYQRLHGGDAGKRALLETKLHGRLAAPWTCLMVVLIALPFGAASGRRNVFVGVASSIVICFIYFVLLQVALALGTGGYALPWLAAWGPNLLFGLAGVWLSWRVR
jgi:lipopolysaccharide export system permease protein